MGIAPEYMADLLNSYEPERSLRPSDRSFLVIPESNLETKGERGLFCSGPSAVG